MWGARSLPQRPGWIDCQKRHVPRASPDAFHHRTRSRVFDLYELNTHSRGERAPEINCRPPHLTCRGVLDGYRGRAQAEPHANFAGLHEVCDARVGYLLRLSDRRTRHKRYRYQ